MNDSHLERLEGAVARLAERLERVETDLEVLTGCVMRMSGGRSASETETEQYVTLDQCAAMVHRSKRTLECYRARMPDPEVLGGGGRSALWTWARVRPWLVKCFGVNLPERYPG